MPTITASDFRNGVTFEMDGQVMQVVEFQHVKPGKGAAFVRTKMKNVITGGVTETSFNPTAKFEQAYVERKDMEYSYNDGDLYYFMDPETYDLVPIGAELLGDNFRFVKENMVCKINSYKGKIFAVEPPTFVELEITETDPGFRGDTATNVTKPATLETGAEIKVPHQPRRQDQDRHPHRRVPGALQGLIAYRTSAEAEGHRRVSGAPRSGARLRRTQGFCRRQNLGARRNSVPPRK